MPTDKLGGNYEGFVPDFSIPSNGIEETDRSLFDLFNNVLAFEVEVDSQVTRVPVVFAAGERFALTRRRQPIRDRNNALILPVIAIARQNVDFSPSQSGYGTAISFRRQDQYIIKKRLSSRDRNYQNIINKIRIKNQKNVSSRGNFGSNDIFPGNIAKPGTVASRRNLNNLSYYDDPSGDLLRNDIGTNIFEIISIPYPKFITISYEITFWTQYMQQMNQIVETMFANFSGQDMAFAITTRGGYELVAYIKTPLSAADNFSDYSSDERIIKYTFNVEIPTYIIAPDQPGLPSPVRALYSAPQIEFLYKQTSAPIVLDHEREYENGDQNSFILSDIEMLNAKSEEIVNRGIGEERVIETIEDPFTGKDIKREVKILYRNERSGETVSSARVTIDLQTTLDDIPE